MNDDGETDDAEHIAAIIEAGRNSEAWSNIDIAWNIVAHGYRRTPPVVQPAGAEAGLRDLLAEGLSIVRHWVPYTSSDAWEDVRAFILHGDAALTDAAHSTAPAPASAYAHIASTASGSSTGDAVQEQAPASAAGDADAAWLNEIASYRSLEASMGPSVCARFRAIAARLSAAPADERRGEEMRKALEEIARQTWTCNMAEPAQRGLHFLLCKVTACAREALKRAGGAV